MPQRDNLRLKREILRSFVVFLERRLRECPERADYREMLARLTGRAV